MDAAGNVSAQVPGWLTIDNAVPTVNSRSINTINPTDFTFTINLNEIGTTYYEVTNNVTPPTAAQIKAGTGPATIISFGNFAVGTAATNINKLITGLTPNTLYYVYSVSEDVATNQSTPITADNATTICAPPTVQATISGTPFTLVNATFMTYNWVRGNGTAGVIVIARQGSAVSFVPASGSTYAGQINADFGLATDQGSGNKIVFRGNAATVPITNLIPSTTYHFAVYEYNTANDCYMLTTPLVQNQATTAPLPETTLSAGTGLATISSTVITQPAEVSAFVFQAADAGADGAKTLISQMVFRPGTGNFFADFTQLLPAVGAELFDNMGNGPVVGTIAAGTITFALTSGSGQIGEILNAATKIYTVKVFLRNPLNAAIRATADGQKLVLSLTDTDVTAAAAGSQIAASSANSGSSNGVIDVLATKLLFIQQPTAVLLQNAITPAVTVEATDAIGARDVDFVSLVGITSSAGTLTSSPQNATFAAGLGTYAGIIHTAIGAGLTLTTNSGTLLPNPVSTPTYAVTASGASNIIRNTVFNEPVNIAYDTYQESIDIVNSGSSVVVGKFDIQDGGNSLNDPDGASTILSQLRLDLGTNFNMIRRIALYDDLGTTEIPLTEQAVGSQLLTFAGLNLIAPDNNKLSFTVRVSFKTAVTDNALISFQVIATTSALPNVSSTFAATNAGGAITLNTGNKNQIEVLANKLQFVVQPTNTPVTVTMSPSPTVEAVDALNNRDVDFTSTVGVISTGSLAGSPQITTYVAGLGTYPAIVHTLDGAGIQLLTNSLTVTNSPSNVFQVLSKSSDIIADGSFLYPTNIAYNTFQENVNIVNSASSLVVARFIVRDGGALPDLDLTPTILTNMSLDLGTNFAFIRKIALYDALGTTEIVGTEQLVGGQIVNFAGFTLTAADDNSIIFTVRVSFTTAVIDNQQFSLTVAAPVTAQALNSAFLAPDGGGAVTSVAGNNNMIAVLRTKLLFVLQPTNTFNGIAMSPVTVEAVDPLNTRDVDGSYIVGLTSTGTLLSTPQNATFALGLGTYPSIIHTINGAGLQLSTNSGVITNATSSPVFNITTSNASDIVANGFLTPTNIPYQNFQENFNIVNSPTSRNVAGFDIRDGGGSADADGVGTIVTSITLNLTNSSIIQRIALYDAAGTTEIGTDQVGAPSVTFGGLSLTAPDNGIASFIVRVSFAASVTDNFQFQFTVVSATTQANVSSTFPSVFAVSSIAGNDNRIAVTATKLAFTTNLITPLLPSVNVSSQQATPVVKALDILNNTDLDYELPVVTIACAIPVTPSNTLTRDNAAPNAGVFTFPAAFQYGTTGNGTLTVTSGILTPATSFGVTVQAGTATRIALGAAAPATISSSSVASTTAPGVTVFNFDVIDDKIPTGVGNDDGLPTLISQLTVTSNATNNSITDWSQAIQGATLEDGQGHTLAATSILGSPNRIIFTSIPTITNAATSLGYVDDSTTKNYTLKVYLRTALLGALPSTIDGLGFEFEVVASNFVLAANSTGIVGGESATSGAFDKVAVVATQLRFLSPASAIPVSRDTNLPGITLEATDINNNRDINFSGAGSQVRAISNATGQTMTGGPSIGVTTFTSGVLVLGPTFQFTSGSNGQFVTLSMAAGPGGTTCGVNAICGTSPVLTLLSSFESSVINDPTFAYLPTLPYVNYQENVDIQNSGTSLEIARVLLVDGSRVSFLYGASLITTGTDNDGIPNNDLDGASTNLTSITFRITNPSNLRRIALYNGAVEIGIEQDATIGVLAGDAFHDYTFSGALLTATDGSQTPLSVRVSFSSTAPQVTDHNPIDVSVTAATVANGSSFFIGAGYIAGVFGGFVSPTSFNILDVFATKLDFTIPPGLFAGINEPIASPGVVEAHDKFGIKDLDYNTSATLSASVPITGSFTFASGVLDISNMRYTSAGDGKITVSSGILTSNQVSAPNISVQCGPVDVIHVTTALATGGVITATNLAGGSLNKVIFGVSFNSIYGAGVNPTLNKFTITFSNPISVPINTVFTNIRVFESPINTFAGGTATNVTLPAISGVITQTSAQTILVDFSANKRDLSSPATTLTYFLMVDVDPTASGTTPPIQATVVDGGFGSTTNNNILTSKGSAVSSVFGQTYTFASIFPPVLTSSYPAKGQLNVDPAQATLSLTFSVPVFTLDGVVKLHNQTLGTPGVILNAVNGQYLGGTGTPVSPIDFAIVGGLIPNNVYYVTIAQGNLANLTGIMDQANNVFQGFTFSGTLFFKAANPVPPILLGLATVPTSTTSDPFVSDISLTGAIINATFDQPGKAYFLVVPQSPVQPIPTNAQIKGSSVYPGILTARGNFAISQSNPISQFGLINPGAALTLNAFYNVWMYAENDALPLPKATTFPYASGAFASPFVEGGTGPTLTFKAITGPTVVASNNPTINICNNSFQFLNAPIIISEGSPGNFKPVLPIVPNAPQSVNFVLPAGFVFDVSTPGTLTLLGSDFAAGGRSLSFLGNSILTVTYVNNNNLSLDKIIISGLKVIATSSTSGPIFRLGGNALPSIVDGAPIATLSSFDAPTINFDNSYSQTLGNVAPIVVTSIPDNAQPQSVQLTPAGVPLGDFGPSAFSGPGVNVNILNLSAITPDVPFNITITHADNNGCVSRNPVQYTVYDHNTAINIFSNTGGPHPTPPPSYPAFTPVRDNSPYCIVNTNFVNTNVVINPVNTPAAKKRYIDFNNLAAHYLLTTYINPVTLVPGPGLVANIPTPVPLTPLGMPQLISGAGWQTLIQTLPQTESIVTGPPFNPIALQTYTDYSFDEAVILDAAARSGGVLPDPYTYFRSAITAQGNYYYTGGSLGLVEFTGTFQSISNATVKVPRIQLVEFFLPAVPLIEVNTSNRSFLDLVDPRNPVGKNPLNFVITQVSNTGTPVYCGSGGQIVINGYPAASVGSSVGTFTLRQAFTPYAPILDPLLGFSDAGNGVAYIDPTKLTNNFNDILITYTYKENRSPCQSSSSQVLRISPNPVSGFTLATNPLTPNAPTAISQCEGQALEFTSTSVTPIAGDPSATITLWSWNFGETSSATNIITGNLLSGANKPSHSFSSFGAYVVSLVATSNYNCASAPPGTPVTTIVGSAGIPLTKNVDIGKIPVVKFKLEGISTSDAFKFSSNDTPPPVPPLPALPFPYLPLLAGNNTTVSSNDKIVRYDWDFGDSSPITTVTGLVSGTDNIDAFNANVTTKPTLYLTPGPKQINLTVTSFLGCVNSLSLQNTYRTIVVLPRVTLPVNGVYVEDFEASNANWQVWGTGKTIPAISAGAASATWSYGPPTYGALNVEVANPPVPLISKLKVWKTGTGASGLYNPGEKSALYSPSFDLQFLTRPMLSFNSVVQIERSDGVVLEYSTDNLNIADPNKFWQTLGVIGDGEDWYRFQGIAGRPGTQLSNDYGWSDIDETDWQAPKHIIDIVGGSTKGVFRFALGSAAPVGGVRVQGFTLDNVRIGDRTRTILLESFVNTGNALPAEKTQALTVKKFQSTGIGTEVVKINYHVGFPGKDPFNDDNPADPSSRALFYNVVTTPRSLLDGEKDPQDRLFSNWGQSLYNLRTLQLAQAVIATNVVNNIDGSISISGTITSSVLTGIPAKTVLHIAVLEAEIVLTPAQKALVKSGEDTVRFTLKKMLPSASGTPFTVILPPGQPTLPIGASRPFGPYVWMPDTKKLYPATGDIKVAVFLQQEDAPYEVYQVELYKLPITEPSVVTGLEPIPADEIIVYPNPANHEMNIKLPGVLAQPAALQLFDQIGRVSMNGTIPEGANSKTITTRDLAAGLYILQIEIGPGNFTRKKVMVVHE